ncbi:MAG: hypothetical protein KDK24_19610 [Pseudooceanicola sp.]|nr:hypothetical protein [Pseudooceanicola sp.]
MKLHQLLVTSAAVIFPAIANAAAVDLSSWAGAEGDAGQFNWVIAGDNNSVLQTVNGNPTVFHNGVNSQGNALSGTIEVQTTGDDDFIGFVLGYKAGDLKSATADYLLIDWKQLNQGSFGCNADVGLSISRVSGTLGNDSGAWCHEVGSNVTELQRGTTLGSTGWQDNTIYNFEIVFTAALVEVKVNGVKELSVAGSFADGSFGFYNYSQSTVRYGALQEDVLPDPDPDPNVVPLPASLPMLAAGLGLVGLVARRRRA